MKALIIGAACALLPLSAFAAQLSAQDRNFIEHAASGGTTEVQEAQVAQGKAQSPQVKQFAQRLIDDHTKNNQQLMTLAQQLGVTVPTTPTATDQQEMSKLQSQSGKSFDHAYVQHEVTDHQHDITMFQQEIQNGSDPQVKAFAQQTLPILREHLRLAQQLQKQA